MGNNNNWQVQAPSINLYALDDMYKNRNIIPTGENTLVDMLQSAWNKGKKALQEDFKNNVIGNTDSAEITKAKAQGMTTNQYLQNQVSNKGWLMDYIADPLSNSEVQAAANALDKDELAKYKKYLNQQTYDKYVTDRTGATTDAVADLQKTLLARPVNERPSLLHDAIFNIGKGTAEKLINPNDTFLMELNKQLVLDGKQPILGEDIMHSPERLLQALRGMDKSEGTKLYDTVAAREGFNSLFTKGPNEAKSRADEILGTNGKFAKAVKYSRDATELMNAFNLAFSNLDDLTPQILEGWKTTQLLNRGIDPNSSEAKDMFADVDALVGNYVNNELLRLMQNYGNSINSGNINSLTLVDRNKARQAIDDFYGKWGVGTYINPTYKGIHQRLNDTDDRGQNVIKLGNIDKEIARLTDPTKYLTVDVSSNQINNLLGSNTPAHNFYYDFKNQLIQAAKDNPKLKGLDLTDDDYKIVAYNFINQAYTPTSKISQYARQNGLDLSNLGENSSKWNDIFNAKKLPILEDTDMDPIAALRYLALKRLSHKVRGN